VEDAACRVIAADETPDHVTISGFGRAFLRCCRVVLQGPCVVSAGGDGAGRDGGDRFDQAGGERVAGRQSHVYEGLKREAQRILDEAARTDAREDQQFGDRRGDELLEELANPGTRAERMRELLG
jgi:hypothetical protein